MGNIEALVKARRSVRTFDGRELSSQDLESLKAFAGSIKTPYGIPVEFKFLQAKEHGLVCPVCTGTSQYVAAKIARAPYSEEAFGHAFEQFVLHAQSLGIGTVWLGGTMNREAFEKAMELEDEQKMPCASPLGYPAKKMSARERMMRKSIKADSRMPFETLFFEGEFGTPLAEAKAGALALPLEMVRWAPSAVNKQPWRVVAANSMAHFYLQHTNGFVSNSVDDMQKVDLGIALCHFELAAAEAGLAPEFCIENPGIDTTTGVEYIASYRLRI